MSANYTAVVRRDGRWWIGWVEELPGVNSQGETRAELLDNLRSALREILEINRADALAAMEGDYEEVSIEVRSGES
ncbi:MAG: type II toxin-antitoxin system HicB family antitoxin [Isosphaeraceae bacterium]|jgi:predicted RNase H-like HicB family nuclease